MNQILIFIIQYAQSICLTIVLALMLFYLKKRYTVFLSMMILKWGYLLHAEYLPILPIKNPLFPRKRRWLSTIKFNFLGNFQGVKSYADPRDLSLFTPQNYQEERQIFFFSQELQKLCKRIKSNMPHFDSRLYVVAKYIEEALTLGQSFPHSTLIKFACSQVGLIHDQPHIHILKIPESKDENWAFDYIRPILEEKLIDLKHSVPFEYAMRLSQASSQSPNIQYLILLIQEHPLKISKPFLRSAPTGWKVNVQGEYPKADLLTLLFRCPNGHIQRGEIKQQFGFFNFDLPTDQVGCYQIEVIHEKNDNQEVLLSFPWWYGENELPPKEFSLTASFVIHSRKWIEELRFYQMLASYRAKAKQRPVALNLKGLEIAQNFNALWYKQQKLMDFTTQEPLEINAFAKKSGFSQKYNLIGSISGTDIEDIWDQLFQSPSKQLLLLSPDMSEVVFELSQYEHQSAVQSQRLIQSNGNIKAFFFFVKSPQKLKYKRDLAIVYRWVQDQRKSH